MNVHAVYVCALGVRGWQKVFFSIILHLIRGARISHLNSALVGSSSLVSQLALALRVFAFQALGFRAGCYSHPEVTRYWNQNSGLHTYVVKCFTH